MQQATKLDKCLELLRQSGDSGLSKEEVIKQTGTKAVFSLMHSLRKRGAKIISINSRYFLKAEKEYPTVRSYSKSGASELPGTDDAGSSSDMLKALSNRAVLKDISEMETTERIEFLELVRKALFYKMTTEAYLKARRAIDVIVKGSKTVLGS